MSNYKKYKEYKEIIKNYSYALFVMSFDEATICPKKDKENSLNVQNYFQREIIKIVTSDEYFNLLKKLSVATDIDIVDKEAIIKEIEDLEKSRRIPNELRFKGMDIINKSSLTWEEARETLDYKPFLGNFQSKLPTADRTAAIPPFISLIPRPTNLSPSIVKSIAKNFQSPIDNPYGLGYNKGVRRNNILGCALC